MMQFREDLNQVPWADLTHAYGGATDTPGHLLALRSDDPDERHRALDELWASICHQGSVYEASCAAVPFLIRLLREGPPEGRPSILYLLAGLAHRDWHVNRNVRTLSIEHTFDDEHRMHDRQVWWCPGEFLTQGNVYHEVQWMTRAHALVAEGLTDYLALLTSEDTDTAQAALHLLAAFPEAGDPVVEAIDERLADWTRAGAAVLEADTLLALGSLLTSTSPLWGRHLIRLATGRTAESGAHPHPLVRYATAVALARFRPTATPPEAVVVLVDAVVEPQRLDEQYELLSSVRLDASVHVEACQLLSQLPGPHGVDALVAALDRGAGRWRIIDTVRVAEALLDAAFFGGWVQDRYWSRTVPREAGDPLERMAQELLKGDRRPYEERSYHQYGRSSMPDEPFKIKCYGYVREEAERLREHLASAGGAGLAADQRRALEAVLRCAPLWNVSHNLLDIYGLPRERDALEALLSGE